MQPGEGGWSLGSGLAGLQPFHLQAEHHILE
jgi:hypothetical protein